MSDRDLELPDADLPEAVQLYAALGVAVLALELVADDKFGDPRAMARAGLDTLRRRHPCAADLMAASAAIKGPKPG